MFNAILIGSTPARSRLIQRATMLSEGILPVKIVDGYPTSYELTRWLSNSQPDLVLLDGADTENATRCAVAISTQSPQTAIIGIGEWRGGAALSPTVVGYPPEPITLLKAVDQAVHQTRSSMESNLLTFQPSKAGNGSSTLALNTAMSLAQLKRRVLVVEADLRSGVMSIMLNVEPVHSLQQVLRSRDEMDLFRIRAAITQAHGVDFLLSNRAFDGYTPAWEDYFRLLEIVKSRYDDILVDLPELVNPGTREFVQRSRLVFSVCTPELLSIKLAERRLEELRNWSVPEERMQILVNRWRRGELGPEEIGKQLRLPVKHTFPSDYATVRESLTKGTPVGPSSELGRALHGFASGLAGILPRPVKRSGGLLDWLGRGVKASST